jgi:hypothetical protein
MIHSIPGAGTQASQHPSHRVDWITAETECCMCALHTSGGTHCGYASRQFCEREDEDPREEHEDPGVGQESRRAAPAGQRTRGWQPAVRSGYRSRIGFNLSGHIRYTTIGRRDRGRGVRHLPLARWRTRSRPGRLARSRTAPGGSRPEEPHVVRRFGRPAGKTVRPAGRGPSSRVARRARSLQKFSFTPIRASRGGTMLSGRSNEVPELHWMFWAGLLLNRL